MPPWTKTIGYFEPLIERMNNARSKAEGLPIASGVTEAACKLIIKQRLCDAGVKWSHTPSPFAARCTEMAAGITSGSKSRTQF